MARVVRFVLTLVLIPIVLVVGLVGWVAYRFVATRPQVEGTVAVFGPSQPVTVVRDEHGVPHVYGATEADVFFAVGYLHAQDRFFQMDMIRRFVRGRLSEVLGKTTVRADTWVRLRGLPELAKNAAERISPELRAGFEAYAAGVNARLLRGAPSPEYTLFLFEPEPWTFEDCVAVVVYMAEDLSVGWKGERSRMRLGDVLSEAQLEEFLPAYPSTGPTTLQSEDLPETPPSEVDGAEAGENPAPGSNAWVVSSTLSETGAPLLANDPHLGIGVPSIWYLVHLALEDGDVVGASIPGAPLVILGRNERIAWGYTNSQFDVTDLERAPEGLAVRSRKELIRVRGGDDVEVTVRISDRGPVLDAQYFRLAGGGDYIWRSTMSEPDNRVSDAAYRIMKAQDWGSFIEAGRGWTAPMQNMLFASVDGDIGYTTPGKLPLRDADGRWEAFIPYEELPRVINPKAGRILTANNRVTPPSYPYPVPGRYRYFRAVRLEELFQSQATFSVQDFADFQLDVKSVLAVRLRPVLAAAEPKTELGRKAQARLEAWDGTLVADGPEALIYAAWFRAIHPLVYADELGAAAASFRGPKPVFLHSVLVEGAEAWCDDIRTPAKESCPERVGAALDAAMTELEARMGSDIDGWRWDTVHYADFDHPILSKIPVLASLFTVRVPMGGGGSTLNVGSFPMEGGYEVSHAASFRAIYDLSNLDRSRFVHAPGQSGHPLSPHFSDLAELWGSGRYIEIPAKPLESMDGARLVFKPE